MLEENSTSTDTRSLLKDNKSPPSRRIFESYELLWKLQPNKTATSDQNRPPDSIHFP
jgi:hypothetical protein